MHYAMQMELLLCPVLVYNFSKLAQLEQLNADVGLANVQVCREKLAKQNIVYFCNKSFRLYYGVDG